MSVLEAYPHERWTRVAVLPAVANIAEPTISEVQAGTEITCDLPVDGGLDIDRSTRAEDQTPWRGPRNVDLPERYRISATLIGFRATDHETCENSHAADGSCCLGTLWPLAATFRARAFLLIRRGLPSDQSWAIGDPVEVLDFRWGKRSTDRSRAGTPVLFTVPLFVRDDDDDAVIGDDSPGSP